MSKEHSAFMDRDSFLNLLPPINDFSKLPDLDPKLKNLLMSLSIVARESLALFLFKEQLTDALDDYLHKNVGQVAKLSDEQKQDLTRICDYLSYIGEGDFFVATTTLGSFTNAPCVDYGEEFFKKLVQLLLKENVTELKHELHRFNQDLCCRIIGVKQLNLPAGSDAYFDIYNLSNLRAIAQKLDNENLKEAFAELTAFIYDLNLMEEDDYRELARRYLAPYAKDVVFVL